MCRPVGDTIICPEAPGIGTGDGETIGPDIPAPVTLNV